MAAAAAVTTTRTQETSENFNIKACLNDLTKIPQKEFEAQFRNWMEKDGVARAMQAKLRADLIANFNKTNLGKHIIGQTPTNRLTLSPMEMALNTLVAEFLFAQHCHFTLSVYSTEAPFRNTLPDFDSLTHFRFKDNEVTEIVKAICGPLNYDWNIKNRIMKNYVTNKNTALLYFILKAFLDNNAETAQQKVSVGTNTRPLKLSSSVNHQPGLSSDPLTTDQTRRDSKAEFYNTNFRYLNRYLIILSRKVKSMSEQFEKLQYNKDVGAGQPRVRAFKSMGRRKYDDLNRSLERVTENLKQMANAKRKSKRVDTIVKAIEALGGQFKKCAENFEQVSKDLKISAHSKTNKSSASSELINLATGKNPSITTTNVVASQTEVSMEKSFVDWLHEMRYTRNGQKFLDRIEKSFLKALEKQKRELLAENEVKLRHQKELLRIRYKQKVLQEICSHGSLSAQRTEVPASNVQSNETISEQFRQFELKHFDLLSKIYESETEHRVSDSRNFKETPLRTAEKAVHFNVKENQPLNKSSSELESYDFKLTSSSDNIEQPQQSRQVLKEKNANDLRLQVKETIGELVAEENNVDQIVMEAKQRMRELELEGNQLTENFLGYLDRQREQKMAAREAAQSLWNDYMNEREKMQQHYTASGHESKDKTAFQTCQSKVTGDLQNKQKDNLMETLELFLREYKLSNNHAKKQYESVKHQNMQDEQHSKDSSSESSSSYMELKNPIIKAKENFFERGRQFKAETSKQLLDGGGGGSTTTFDLNDFLKLNATQSGNEQWTTLPATLPTTTNSWFAKCLSQSLNETNAEATNAREAEMAVTSNVQLAANWQGSLEIPQNGSVNKSQRREIIATAKEAMRYQRTTTELTTNAILAAAAVAATATTKTTTTVHRALNKNNADGASVAEAQQEHSSNYKIKNDVGYGQKQHTTAMEQQRQQQKNEMRNKNNNNSTNSKCNNNKTSNIKSNGSTEFEAVATETSMAAATTIQTWKPTLPKPKVSGSNGAELSRRAVLKQSMARMQQLFSPHQAQHYHHQQQQQQQRRQQITLANVSEEEENVDAESSRQELQIAMGKMEKSWQKEKSALQSITKHSHNNNNKNPNRDTTNTNGQNVVFDAAGDAVDVGQYKNNFLSKQKIIKSTAKDQQAQQQHQQVITEKIPPTTSLRRNHERRTETATTTNNRITGTTLHSIDEGNKTVEALVDWQQIACGPSGRQNEATTNADKVKVTNAAAALATKGNDYSDNELLGEYDDDDFEKHIENELTINLPLEPGEIFERNQTPTETANQAEIGELIEQLSDFGEDVDVPFRMGSGLSISSSEESSSDLQLSVGGGANRGRSHLTAAASGASDSDFWA